MHVIVARFSAAYTILASVAAAVVAVGAMPAHAQAADMSCPAINAEVARLSSGGTTEASEDAAAKKSARRHMMLGFAKTMATSMLPFGGMIGGGSAGGMVSALGQAAAQAGLENAANAATRPAVTHVDSQQRLAQLSAMSAARGCTPA